MGSHSDTTSLASELVERLREIGEAHLEALESTSVHLAVKAIVVCRWLPDESGIDIVLVPSFAAWTVLDEPRTAIRFSVHVRKDRKRGPRPI